MIRIALLLIAYFCAHVFSDDDCIVKALELLKDHDHKTETTEETPTTTYQFTNNGSSINDLRSFERLYLQLKENFESKYQKLQNENDKLRSKLYSSNIDSIHTIQTFCTCNITDRLSSDNCRISQDNVVLEKIQQIHQQLANITGNIGKVQTECKANEDFSKITRKRRTNGKYVGCYRDRIEHRGLRGFSTGPSSTNSVDACIAICRSGNYVYAGLQIASWCFCGNTMQQPTMNDKLSDSSCNQPCTGNKSQICGAYGVNSIYETGVEQYLIDEEGRQLPDSYIAPVPGSYYTLTVNCG